MNEDQYLPENSKYHLEIRQASKADVPMILDFIRLFAKHNNVIQNLVATKEILEASLFGEKPTAEVIIPCLNNTPVGYALFTYNFSTLLGRPGIYLVDLFLLQNARQQGVGRTVIAYLANLAREKNYGRLEWSVNESNKQAISFYEGLGATPLNEWKSYRVSDDLLDKFASEYQIINTQKMGRKS